MNQILQIIIYIASLIILSLLLGWILARLKLRRMMKKLDRELNTPETIDYINKQIDEQNKATSAREVDQNDRKRRIFRGYGDRQLIPIEFPSGRKQQIEEPIKQSSDKGRDEKRSGVQDTDIDKIRENEQPDGRTNRDSEESWPDFD